MTTSRVAVARDVRFLRQDPEHDGLVGAVVWGCARVVPEFDDCVAPGPGPHDVAYVGDCESEGVSLFDCAEVVAESTTGPGWALVEEVSDDGDCFSEGGVLGF